MGFLTIVRVATKVDAEGHDPKNLAHQNSGQVSAVFPFTPQKQDIGPLRKAIYARRRGHSSP